ncbi:acyl-CoA thioesterase [Subtercola boreus]|uniref:4-hydroxybenzoyl-CoA thioesterase n=1 Tax=Subtercola boreus TaxID=120213 RepID=A0A3E0WE84_9MICO|nr:thioesterase family protein [Subtercola boreus]RFA22103.1 4-hydroxybenzoyl-CoA thioesterase [Subtercola boreus]RFA22283.1 4-hydroxybenzoyl-CoA thioesterase [Subtercola boreus]RFA28146.1 4-hydroxybenzoyl-CoA thioesterase [Subtercola boreus]
MRLHVPARLRWSDLDAYGHVNNVQMLRLLEEARIEAFWSPEETAGVPVDCSETAVLNVQPGSGTLSLIARQEIEYLVQVPYLRQSLDIQLWLGRLGGASLEVCYEVWNPETTEPRVLFTRAATTLVLADSETGRPRRISDVERAAWSPYVEAPLEFSRRR